MPWANVDKVKIGRERERTRGPYLLLAARPAQYAVGELNKVRVK